MSSSTDTVKKFPHGDTSWFTHDRFGMFIHWGLYAGPARGEWVMNHESIPIEEYERKYFKNFDPDLYNPELWADAAANAGMKYSVLTTKHHEGFCLWDTKYTDYKATNTLAKRDLLHPYVDAFRAKGLRAGFYYSLLDWHHPQNFIDRCIGPYRHLSAEDMAKMNAGRNQSLYAEYMRNQVKELLTGYGPIDVLWFDFSYPNKDNPKDFSLGKGRYAWESEKLIELVRSIAPNIILDDRLDIPGIGDIITPEQYQPRGVVKVNGKPVVWETCQTFSGSWGYDRDEKTWRGTGEIIRTLIDSVSKDGNLLLNVGPTGRGELDYRALDRLQGIGRWMKYHSRSIYGCGAAPAEFKAPAGCNLTYNPQTKRLYIHILSWQYANIFMEGIADRIEYARFLHDDSEVLMGLAGCAHEKEGYENVASFRLPMCQPGGAGVEVPVIEVILK